MKPCPDKSIISQFHLMWSCRINPIPLSTSMNWDKEEDRLDRIHGSLYLRRCNLLDSHIPNILYSATPGPRLAVFLEIFKSVRRNELKLSCRMFVAPGYTSATNLSLGYTVMRLTYSKYITSLPHRPTLLGIVRCL